MDEKVINKQLSDEQLESVGGGMDTDISSLRSKIGIRGTELTGTLGKPDSNTTSPNGDFPFPMADIPQHIGDYDIEERLKPDCVITKGGVLTKGYPQKKNNRVRQMNRAK